MLDLKNENLFPNLYRTYPEKFIRKFEDQAIKVKICN